MKKHTLILIMASMAVLLSGCINPDGSPNNTGSGALIGGAFGAFTGVAIGADTAARTPCLERRRARWRAV